MAVASAHEKVTLSAPYMRRHGCERPWAPAQIIAVGIVLLSVIVFYAFSVHELPSHVQLTVMLLVTAQLAMVVLLFVSISLLDPAHPAVIEHRQRQRQHERTIVSATQSPDDSVDLESDHHHPLNICAVNPPNSSNAGHTHSLVSPSRNATTRVTSPALSAASSSSASSSSSSARGGGGRLHCVLCDVSVSVGTRHCSVCGKCIAGFDHHCVYLNTCIGARNYPLFIALLTCSISLVATQLVLACVAIDRLNHRGATSLAILVGLLCVLPLLQLISMLVLAAFHSYLFYKGLKTYEWLRRFQLQQQQSVKYTGSKTPTWKPPRRAARRLGGRRDAEVEGEEEDDDDKRTDGEELHDPAAHTVISIASRAE